jgi:SAM-dependent methyltransferase
MIDSEVKAKHRALWAMGDYAAVAADLVAPLGPILVDSCEVISADRVLDVAAGTGNAAIPAAVRGADVTGVDLTPELIDIGETLAKQRGAKVTWAVGDAEALPYPDGDFDVVMSCLGVMFAPRHQIGADELIRVSRPGARIGLLSWTPTGFIGQMFATMKPYVPAPPPGAQPPPLWGDESHVRALLGDRVTDVAARRGGLRVDHFTSGAGFRDYFKANYGPTIVAYKNIAADEEKVAALDAELAALGDRFLDRGAMQWEYLVVTARRIA